MINNQNIFAPKKIYNRICSICEKPFQTNYIRQSICDFECSIIAQRNRARIIKQRKKDKKYPACEICGFDEITEIHLQGKKQYNLCPNHHRIITYGKKTLKQLFKECSPEEND